MTPPVLWHFTCSHTRARVGGKGWLVPSDRLAIRPIPADATPGAIYAMRFVWLTENPVGAGAGLELYADSILTCDRLEHRYRAAHDTAERWWDVDVPRAIRLELDCARPGLDPSSWWVAAGPVLVLYDPSRR